MKPRLLELLVCPSCRSALTLAGQEERQGSNGGRAEVTQGVLSCASCGRQYPVEGGFPRFVTRDAASMERKTNRTASTYSYLWTRTRGLQQTMEGKSYHFEKMKRALNLPAPTGLILDAGCGSGVDLVNRARKPGVEIVGVELSEGGCRSSYQRTLGLPSAHVVQTDLCRLPFEDGTFDFVYSYGVLHHLIKPGEGLHELIRVLKPGGSVAVYLYEDFEGKTLSWRWLLSAANLPRRVTPYLPHSVLYLLCQLASPLIYSAFTVPYFFIRGVPGLQRLAENIPFRHGTGPFRLAGDLYDRYAVPIERRYSRAGACGLFQEAGLEQVRSSRERGWMLVGTKPSRRLLEVR